MARRRYLSTDISLDSRVNQLAVECGDFAVLLYTWMIPHAEDDASLGKDSFELMLRVLPGRRDKTIEDVNAALAGMVALGLVEIDDNAIRFPSMAFYTHQSYITDGRRRKATEKRTAHISANPRTFAQKAASSSSSLKVSSSVSLEKGGASAARALLEDAVFTEELRVRFSSLDFDYECQKWRDYVTETPPKSNYKNSLRNWLERADEWRQNGRVTKDQSRNGRGSSGASLTADIKRYANTR